jgi:hypothetical protein
MRDIIEPVMESLSDLLNDEGLFPMPVERVIQAIQAITSNDLVNSLENLLSDYNALSDIILRIHFVDEVFYIYVYIS